MEFQFIFLKFIVNLLTGKISYYKIDKDVFNDTKEREITMKNPNLGRMLRYYRNANSYSVKEVVAKLNKEYDISISPKTLYGWENSQNQPSADTLLVLCKLYKINNILDSLGYEGTPEQAPLILTPEERELIIKYRSHKYFNSAIRKLLDISE